MNRKQRIVFRQQADTRIHDLCWFGWQGKTLLGCTYVFFCVQFSGAELLGAESRCVLREQVCTSALSNCVMIP